jgi:hypothetical protein
MRQATSTTDVPWYVAPADDKDNARLIELVERKRMIRVLVIGYAPNAVDFTDPAVPPGLTEAIVAEGIERDVQLMQDWGWEAEHLPIRADESLRHDILSRLASKSYDCIVIGAGVRMTTKHVAEFEQVIYAVRQGAPLTPIAFNTSPDSSGEAAARWLS